ncbi:MAG: peptide chain release factor N(5)-glutamine methyltransferase [Sphingobacteriia bacterium]|nr:peptide chain release factor N(5)-glutamine methyltransferase [Sphingobacteriia bacterium]
MDKITFDIAQQLMGFSDTPFLDARFFVSETQDSVRLQDYVQRRKQGEPVAKIIGHKGFWSLELNVTKDTLDPRPDSETLIETVLKFFPNKNQSLRILDIGTGSGCLLLALLSEYKNANGVGIDISKSALNVAIMNAKKLNATFVQLDWTQPNWIDSLGQFDIVVSNPPYIPTAEIDLLDVEVKKYDPLLALDGGKDGLDAYRTIGKKIKDLLKPNGKAFFEIGCGQEKDVARIMPLSFIGQYSDLGQIIRCLVFEKK